MLFKAPMSWACVISTADESAIGFFSFRQLVLSCDSLVLRYNTLEPRPLILSSGRSRRNTAKSSLQKRLDPSVMMIPSSEFPPKYLRSEPFAKALMACTFLSSFGARRNADETARTGFWEHCRPGQVFVGN